LLFKSVLHEVTPSSGSEWHSIGDDDSLTGNFPQKKGKPCHFLKFTEDKKKRACEYVTVTVEMTNECESYYRDSDVLAGYTLFSSVNLKGMIGGHTSYTFLVLSAPPDRVCDRVQ
jgi:hypothetical protein